MVFDDGYELLRQHRIHCLLQPSIRICIISFGDICTTNSNALVSIDSYFN